MSNFKSQISQTHEENYIRDKTKIEINLSILYSKKTNENMNI